MGGARPPSSAALGESGDVQGAGPGRVELQAQEGPRDLAVEVPRELLGAVLGRRPQAGLVGLADLAEPAILEGREQAEEHGDGAHPEHERAGERGRRVGLGISKRV